MAINKVVMNTTEGEETLIDLTEDTVTAQTLASGATAHDATGEVITGTMRTVDDLLENVTRTDVFEWDGNTEGLQVFDMTGDGQYLFYPVSENVLSLEDLANGVTIETTFTGGVTDVIRVTDYANMSSNIIASRSVANMLFVLEDNATLYGNTIPKKGIYFLASEENGYISRIEIEGYTGFNSEVEVLKKKYLTVDSALSETSTNPVQNKVVAEALSGKVSTTGHTGKNVYLGTDADGNVVYKTVPIVTVSIDSSLNGLSENPVTNKAITEKFSELSGQISDIQDSIGEAGTSKVLRYDAQVLTDAQKEQARNNIGATTQNYVDNEILDVKALMNQLGLNFAEGETLEEQLTWLSENGDSGKAYVLADGFVYAYKETVTEGGEPLFTNALDGVTKNINKRWSRSSKALSNQVGYLTIDIPIASDKKVYMNLPATAFSGSYSRIHYMDSSGNYVSKTDKQANKIQSLTTDANGITSWTTGYEFGAESDPSTNARLSGADNITRMVVVLNMSAVVHGSNNVEITESHVADTILSIGNPIEYSTGSVVKEWGNTGHAFVPADYDEVIADLVNITTQHTKDILKLKETGGSSGTKDAIELIKNWDSPIYDKTPVFQLTAEKLAITTTEKTVDAVYSKYDALMDAHPDFITKTDLGLCSDGVTHVYRYDFKEAEPHSVLSSNWSETKPKIIIVSGVHREWGGIYSLYNALEEITTNEELDELRRNLHLIVVPIMNPYCIIGDVWNKNYNGVEVRRNFEVGFQALDSTAEHYGGTEPLSEVESQYIDNIFKSNTDSAYFLSCHSMTRDNLRGTGFVWGSSATKYMCNMAFRLIDKMSKAWHKKYGTTWEDGIARENNLVLSDSATYPSAVKQEAWDYRAGWASISTSAGTEQRQATKYGIQATNLEVCDYFRVLDNSQLSAKAITHGAEVYINFFLTVMGVYDNKDKKEYYI